MPDWLLTIPRWLWSPIRWAGRRLRRHALDRHALVREGSRVVAPVIELVNTVGPTPILWGSDEHQEAHLQERHTMWSVMRGHVLTYANQHPSDRVRASAHELADAVSVDLVKTALLLRGRKTESTMDSYHASEQAHAEALDKAERLMDEIRRY
jgi:hypothetical protein